MKNNSQCKWLIKIIFLRHLTKSINGVYKSIKMNASSAKKKVFITIFVSITMLDSSIIFSSIIHEKMYIGESQINDFFEYTFLSKANI